MKNVLIFFLAAFAISACKNSQKENDTTLVAAISANENQEHPGKKLLETYCYACHDATTTEDKRLAPPMIAIKRRYIFKDTTKDEFIADMQNWVKNPNEKGAKMFGAVKRFGVMQKLPYPDDVVKQIADYVYSSDIEQPEWFEAHFSQNRGMR